MKPQKSAICNVIGYSRGEGHRSLLEALLIAQYRENRLIDRGRVGSGISTKVLGELLSLLHPLAEKNGVTWVDPSLQSKVNPSAPRHKCRGLLRVDPERRFSPALKGRGFTPSNG